MTGTTFADRVALATSVLEMYKESRAELARKGIQPDYWIKALEASLKALLREEANQESAKAQLQRSTQAVHRLDRETYRIAAGAIDAAIGAYGRGTPKAMRISRVRSQLHRRKAKESPPKDERSVAP